MAEIALNVVMRDKIKAQGRSASAQVDGKQSPVMKILSKSASLDAMHPDEDKDRLERGDAIQVSDSEEDALPDPKILFRRNSDVRKCVSIRKSVRRESGRVAESRERFREQRRFSSPSNSFDLSKSLNLGNDHRKKGLSECSVNIPVVKGHLNANVRKGFVKNKHEVCDEDNSDKETSESVTNSPREKAKDEGEKLTDLVENGKKISRVELLLNNSLFKKHLSNHADLIQRHTISSRRYGLRKSVSNIDISCIEFDQSVLSNVTNKVQNVEKSEKTEVKTDPKHNENSPSAVLSRRLSRQLRRTSLSCMDVSTIGDFLSSSLPNFKENPTKRKKVHIPSFEEFRKQRNLTSGNWRGVVQKLEHFSPSAQTESSKPEDATSVIELNHGLDPISEDIPCENETEQPKDTITDLANALTRLTTKTRNDFISVSASNNDEKDVTVPSKNCVGSVGNSREEVATILVQDVSSGKSTGGACAIMGENSCRTNSPEANDVQFDEVFIEVGKECNESGGGRNDDFKLSANTKPQDLDSALTNSNSNRLSLSRASEDVSQSEDITRRPDSVIQSSADMGTHPVSAHPKDDWTRIKPAKHGDSVLRSTSDVSISDHHKKRRERKERPYKSDPFSGADTQEVMSQGQGDSVPFQSTPKKDVLSLLGTGSVTSDTPSYQSLEELQEGEESESESDTSSNSTNKVRNRLSNVSTTSTDSGVIGGVDMSCDRSFDFNSQDYHNTSLNNLFPRLEAGSLSPEQDRSTVRQEQTGTLQGEEVKNIPCPDCNPRAMPPQLAPHENSPPPCQRCLNLRNERKETIQEIVDTEISYGRDLKILRDEFYTPMKTTGLLSGEQLEMVFLNLHELIHCQELFLQKLQAEVVSATNNNEENLSGVCIGSLFAESSSMFLAFENFCIHQAHASQSLEQFEKEKELLHVFLQASQRDNSLLRRMHLKSFLMVPVQRIMKYPLLLNRLYKLTPALHKDKENIKLAQSKIEDNLEHINAKAKFTGSGSFRIKRKRSRSHGYSLSEKSEVNKVALEVLGWNIKEVGDLITSRLMYATPTDHTWAAKKCKNLKFGPIHGVLLTLGQPKHDRRDREHNLVFPKPTHIQQAAVVLVREKNGKFQAIRDPLMLDKCVVTVDPEYDEVFELHEWGREALVFKADDPADTRLWVQHLKQQTRDLGQWRRRRNALPNIMIKNV